MTSLPGASRFCSTCVHWGGSRQLQPGGQVQIHPYSKGPCQGGGFRFAVMAALATCRQWEFWPAAAPNPAPKVV